MRSAAARRGHRLDAGADGSAIAGSAARRRLRTLRCGRHRLPAIHKNRRAMIFFGANDGMIHAVDARTGYEVWAFIPYNLLPKLRDADRRSAGRAVRLLRGQLAEDRRSQVERHVEDAAPHRAGSRRNVLSGLRRHGGGHGRRPGRRRYLRGVTPCWPQFDSPDESIKFKWAFPNYSNFDPTYTATFTVTDGTPGGKSKLFGDLKATAAYAEKTVGFTWSDPAVGPLDATDRSTPSSSDRAISQRSRTRFPIAGATAPKAGNALYLINADTGTLIGNTSGSSCPLISAGSGSNTGCVTIGDVAANGRKNTTAGGPVRGRRSG